MPKVQQHKITGQYFVYLPNGIVKSLGVSKGDNLDFLFNLKKGIIFIEFSPSNVNK